jgi:drug/metabolite transporter (DMT)-like permease
MLFREEWFIFALSSMFLVVFIDLIKKYILDKKIITPIELAIYSAMFLGLMGFLHFLYDKNCRSLFKMDMSLFLILLLIGILAYLFNITFTKSIFLAPDVSLTGIIISLNILFIYLFSSLFFEKSPKFNFEVLFGILLIIIGINIISKKFQ